MDKATMTDEFQIRNQVSQPFTAYVSTKENGLGVDIKPDITMEAWSAAVIAYGDAHRKHNQGAEQCKWALYDLYKLGEEKFGEAYSQALDGSTIDDKTLNRILWVGNAYKPAERHPELSFTHHEVLAGVKDSLQREELLKLAEEEDLTVAKLVRIRNEKCPSTRSQSKHPERKKIQCPHCNQEIQL